MDLSAYSVAPAHLYDLTNATSCPFSLPYSAFSLPPICSPPSVSSPSSSPISHLTKSQLLLLRTTQQLLAWSSATAPPPPASSTMALSSDSALGQWALVLVLIALCLSLLLSLLVSAPVVARYSAAYWAAPREIAALLDAADSSLQENESYDRDVATRVPLREDKVRLGRMLQEIQRASDDLREDLNSVLMGGRSHSHSQGSSESTGMSTAQVVDQKQPVRRRAAPQDTASITTSQTSAPAAPSSPQLKTAARILWAARRVHIEERLRRLDMLRMRFLVVYMSTVAAATAAAAEKAEKSAVIVAAAAVSASSPAPAPSRTFTAPAAVTTPKTNRTAPPRTAAIKSAASKTIKPAARATTPALKHVSSSTSCESSSDDDSDSDSDSSSCSSPLMSATSMPTSPRSPQKKAASIVAASIAAAAAAAVASGDTDGKYHPGSPSLPGSPSTPAIPEAPNTPPSSGRSHPFLRSITEQQQLRSPPATPDPNTSPDNDSFRRKPARRVTTLGIRPPEASPENNHRAGWMGVVQELQRSPLLHKRHTSIEMSMARQSK